VSNWGRGQGIKAKAKASDLRDQGQGRGHDFVLDPSPMSRTFLEDPIPDI